jgi:hypothetical protein
MEPVSVLATTAAALFAKNAIEEAGGSTGKALTAAAGKLAAWVRQLGHHDPEASAAVTMVDIDPADQARVALLSKILAARAASNPKLAAELGELVAAAREAGDVHVSADGVHIHGDVTGGQVTQIGGDQYNLGR